MPITSSPVATSNDQIPIIAASNLHKMAGVPKHFLTFADFTAAVAKERARVTASAALWGDGEPITIGEEAETRASRSWSTDLNHARTVTIGSFRTILPGDGNRVRAASGIPASGTGANGDLSVDWAGKAIYQKTSGSWAQTSSLATGGGSDFSRVDSQPDEIYTPVVSDVGTLKMFTAAAGTVVNFALHSEEPIPALSKISFMAGSGPLSFTNGVGVNLIGPPNKGKTALGPNARIDAIQLSTDTWYISGDLAEVAPIAPVTASFPAGATPGTLVANLTNIPTGVTPRFSPADGRVVVAGSEATGWKLVVGLTNSSVGAIAGVVSALGANNAPIAIQVQSSAPVILNSTAISDLALKRTSGNGQIQLGNLSLPDADWTIFFAAAMPTNTGATNQPIFSLGTQSDTVMSDNGTLNILGAAASGITGPAANTVIFTGRDDNGNWLGGRSTAQAIAGSTGAVKILTSEYRGNVFEGMGERLWALCRRGGAIEVWEVDPAGYPTLQESFTPSPAFGAISSRPAVLTALNTVGVTQGSVTVQRFGRIAQALTPAQMVAIAQGVDPRQVATFNAGAGDRLWAFTSNSGTVNDLINSQAATIVGTYTAQTAIIPPTVTAEMVRVDRIRANSGVQRTGVVLSDLPLQGTVTGTNDDIYARLVQYDSQSTIVADWQKVATSAGGVWAGKMSGVPGSSFTRYALQVRKGLAGTVNTLNRPFVIGLGFVTGGQSIMQGFRLVGTGTVEAPATAATCPRWFSNEPGSQPDSYEGSTGTYHRGWVTNKSTAGYGETGLINKLAALAGCPVFSLSAADNGVPIETYYLQPKGTPQLVEMASICRPKYFFWSQGHANSSDGLAYKAKLDKLYDLWRSVMPWDWEFIVIPVNANYFTSSAAAWDGVRRAYKQFVDERRAAGDTKVHLGGSMVNALLNPDGTHLGPTPAAMGIQIDVMAQEILYLEGIAANDANGPVIDEDNVAWDGGNQLIVPYIHNGGTNLHGRIGGNITGFEVGTDQSFSTLITHTATVTNAAEVTITMADTPTSAPWIRYQYGLPGRTGALDPGGSGYQLALVNPLFDDRTAPYNGSLGFSVGPWDHAIPSQLQTVISKPTNVQITSPAAGEVSTSWAAPALGTVDRYEVEVGSVGSNIFGSTLTVPVASPRLGHWTGLPGGIYRTRVRAIFSDGTPSAYVISADTISVTGVVVPAPTGVTVSNPSSGKLRITFTPPAGSIERHEVEYGVAGTGTIYSHTQDALVSPYDWLGIGPGSYSARVRTIFTSGPPSDWVIASNTVTLSGATVIVSADFTGADNAGLGSYVPEIGGAFTSISGYTGQAARIQANMVYSNSPTAYMRNVTPMPSPDYKVAGLFRKPQLSNNNDIVGVIARCQEAIPTFYFWAYHQAGAQWRMYRVVNKVLQQIDVGWSEAIGTNGGNRIAEIEVNGTGAAVNLIGRVAGVERFNVDDIDANRITTAGFMGFGFSAVQTTTTGLRLDHIDATTLS